MSRRRRGERERERERGSERGAEEPRRESVRGAVVPAALAAQILNKGLVGTDAAALGPAQTVEAARLSGAWAGSLLLEAASASLMEEEVTEPGPQAPEPAGPPPGTHSEVNGDLPGNPCLRDGTEDVMESPVREPVVLQYPAEYKPGQQCG